MTLTNINYGEIYTQCNIPAFGEKFPSWKNICYTVYFVSDSINTSTCTIVPLIHKIACIPHFWLGFLYRVKVEQGHQSHEMHLRAHVCSSALKWWIIQCSCSFISHFAFVSQRAVQTSTFIIVRYTEGSMYCIYYRKTFIASMLWRIFWHLSTYVAANYGCCGEQWMLTDTTHMEAWVHINRWKQKHLKGAPPSFPSRLMNIPTATKFLGTM